MPEVAAVNDMYQVRLVGRIEGQETNNVLHFVCVGADTDVATHLIVVLAQCFIDNLLPVLSSAWTFEKIVWKRVAPTLGPEITSIPVGAGAGGGAASALPSYASAVLSIRTILGGASRRGRMYMPGIPEAATLGSLLDTGHAFWAGLLGFAVCVIAHFVPGDPPGAPAWSMGVYSRKLGGSTFPYSNVGFTGMRSMTPVALLGTTRSRKLGRGA